MNTRLEWIQCPLFSRALEMQRHTPMAVQLLNMGSRVQINLRLEWISWYRFPPHLEASFCVGRQKRHVMRSGELRCLRAIFWQAKAAEYCSSVLIRSSIHW